MSPGGGKVKPPFEMGVANFDADAEAGVGFGGKLHFGPATVDASIKPLVFTIDEHGNVVAKVEGGVEGDISDDLKASLYAGYDLTNKKPYSKVGLNNLSFDNDFKLSFGAGLYLGLGGEFNVSVNVSEIERKIYNLFSCESQE